MRMRKKRYGAKRLYVLSDLLYADSGNYERPSEFTEPKIIDPADVFGSAKPLRLELGCGKGDFIRATSAVEDDYNYVALERVTDVVIAALEKYAVSRDFAELNEGGVLVPKIPCDEDGKYKISKSAAGNVRFLNLDVKRLPEFFAPASIDTIYINFCDPWTKKGYAKRRLTHLNFLKLYESLLIPDGKIRFKTDNLPLFNFTLEQLAATPFKILAQTNDLHASPLNANNIMTEYERNFTNQGIKINALIAQK